MRTRAVLTSAFASIGILIVGWQIGAAATVPSVTASAPVAPVTTGGTTTTSTSASSPPSASASPTATSSDGTWTGSSANTPFGSVQVRVTIAGGKISDVTALKLTDADGRSVQISNRAAPMLRQEVLASQSANVSNVGGATYTSQGYLTSLQSALDQAGF